MEAETYSALALLLEEDPLAINDGGDDLDRVRHMIDHPKHPEPGTWFTSICGGQYRAKPLESAYESLRKGDLCKVCWALRKGKGQ